MITHGLSVANAGEPALAGEVERRDLRADDVDIRITYCGICYSDLHAMRLPVEDGGSYPLTPGHEFVGEVVAVGSAVTNFSPGDAVAVGNIVDSCGTCRMCRAGQENFCNEFPTLTYCGRDRHDGSLTVGAWAGRYVARESFVYHCPDSLDPATVAPLMCAGATVWEPLRTHGVGPGTRLGVVGIGGLGHLAIILGAALGAEVTAITTTAAKADDAKRLGAQRVITSTNADDMASATQSLDVIIDTVAVRHELSPLLQLLDLDATLYSVGYLGAIEVDTVDLLIGRKRITSAGSAGRRWTQDLLDFCGSHGVHAEVEVVRAGDVNVAVDRLSRGDVRYRFVLDLRGMDGDLVS